MSSAPKEAGSVLAELAVSVGQEMESRLYQFELTLNTLEAALYAIEGGGKRIRTVTLLSVVADLLGAEIFPEAVRTASVAVASSLELIHESSLVHDDLPALDNDLIRRGRPSVHARFSPGVATMVGNILAAAAFRTTVIPPPILVILSDAYAAVCDGQIRDLMPVSTVAELILTHERKTGTLFGAACALGALVSGWPQYAEILANFGTELGIEFQLRNDLSDSQDARGSSVSSDDRNHKFGPISISEIKATLEQQISKRESLMNTLEHELAGEGRALFFLPQVVSRIAGL